MAYLNFLHAVPTERIEAFYKDQNESLQATRSAICSHLIAYWVQIQPLGQILGEAIDGGEIFHESLWHPFRVPKIHTIHSITALYPQLKEAWEKALEQEPLPEDDWYRIEIDKVVDIFQWAYARGECIVSALQAPHDKERAPRVTFPRIT